MSRKLFLSLYLGLSMNVSAMAFDYPKTRQDSVVDTYFGQTVADPYRWLEDADSDQGKLWVDAQNEVTNAYLNTPARQKIRQRLEEVWNYPKISTPSRKGKWFFSWKNDGLQNQYVLLRHEQAQGPGTVVLDPNTLSTDGTMSVANTALNSGGHLLAYGVSDAGSDEQSLHFRNLNTQQNLPDLLKGLKNSSVDWHPDSTGVFYNRYPEPGLIPGAKENTHNRVYFHPLGKPQIEDLLVHADPAHPDLDFYPSVSEDGQYLVIQSNQGTAPENGVLFREIKGDKVKELIPLGLATFNFVDNDGPVFYFLSNYQASRFRLIAIDIRQPEATHWREVIPQQADVLDSVTRVGEHFVTTWLHDAHHKLYVHSLQGKLEHEIQLPTLGTVAVRGRREDSDFYLGFSSFTHPGESYHYDLKSQQLKLIRRAQVKFDPNAFETQQVFFKSKDGTQVPMFLVYKKGLKPDGSNPALMYGYGGFTVNLLPHLALDEIPWLEAGGVYAVVNLRGGSEYGDAWHKDGMLDKKQNVFDDFIAAGEYLIQSGWAHPKKLATQGASNGGLLTAACLVQRPDLFGAVVSQVPLTDMLRYHRFSVGRYWIPEYGNADASEAEFKTLLAYSPLQNVKAAKYPPTMLMTADHDDRVVPAHAKKFVATLQAKGQGPGPYLVRIETRAGHGAGKPTAKIIDEHADMYAFLFRALGME